MPGAAGSAGDAGTAGPGPSGAEAGTPPSGRSGEAAAGAGTAEAGTGTAGGPSGGGSGQAGVSAALRAALEKTTTRWAAAADGSGIAASLELATGGNAVMAIGGFTGSDPAPTLAQFEAYVKAGDITYYIAGGQGGGGAAGPGGGSAVASQIASWVKAHYQATTIGGQIVYLLTTG
jgi:hypothetical protein